VRFGWKLDQYLSFNRTPDRPPKRKLPAPTVELIQQYNRWDVELYHAGGQLFEKQLTSHREAVTDIVAGLQRAQCATRWNRTMQTTRATVLKAINRAYSAM
jgi:hypothetical protein